MGVLTDLTERLRALDLERRLGLHPGYPGVALELDRKAMTLVRLKPKRRGRPTLESFRVQATDGAAVPATIFDQTLTEPEALAESLRGLFASAGVRPGRISLVLPDNLAKLSLVTLPERPPSRRQLEEVIRFQTRRSIPFRVTDAAMSYQLLPSEGKTLTVFVALMRRALVDRYERALESLGARPGLVALCTPNLLNLCRERIQAASAQGDVAFLNCGATYFTLAIVRGGRLVFFRCKTYSMGNGDSAPVNGLLARELAYSLSYYEEKLEGRGIHTLLVRPLETPFEELGEQLAALHAECVEPIDPVSDFDSEAGPIDASTAQRIAPALGAVKGRG